MSHHHHAQVWSNPECVHYVTYEQFFRVKIETLRKVHACGLAGVIMNWVWVQEFKMGPREMKSQSEVKSPWKADTVGQGWDRLREWGQFLYEGTEGKTTEPDLGTMAYPHPGNCAAHGCYGYRCHEGWLWNVTKASGSLIQPTPPPPDLGPLFAILCKKVTYSTKSMYSFSSAQDTEAPKLSSEYKITSEISQAWDVGKRGNLWGIKSILLPGNHFLFQNMQTKQQGSQKNVY